MLIDTACGRHLEVDRTATTLTARAPAGDARSGCHQVSIAWDGARAPVYLDADPDRDGIEALHLLLSTLDTAGSERDHRSDLQLLLGELLRFATAVGWPLGHDTDELQRRTVGDSSTADVIVLATLALSHRWLYDLLHHDVDLDATQIVHLHLTAGGPDHLVDLVGGLFGRAGRNLVRTTGTLLASGRDHAAGWLVALASIHSGLSDDVLTWLLTQLADVQRTPRLSPATIIDAQSARWLDEELRELSPQRQRRLLHQLASDDQGLRTFIEGVDTLRRAVGTAGSGQPVPHGLLKSCRNIPESVRRLSEVAGDHTRSPQARSGAPAIPASLEPVEGAQVVALTLRLARSPRDLTTWGAALRNCLGTMVSTARTGHCVFFALQDDSGNVRAAGEVRDSGGSWELHELLGPGNSRIDAATWDGVRAALPHAPAASAAH